MAEEQEDRSTDDLSDEPSQYRLQDFREKGRVAQSKELTAVLTMLIAGAMIYAFIPHFSELMISYMKELFDVKIASRINLSDPQTLKDVTLAAIKTLAGIALPITIVAFILSALGSFLQVGAIFSSEPLTPDIKKIDPISGLKKFFSIKQLYDAIRLIVKGTTVVWIAYVIVKSKVITSPMYSLMDPGAILGGVSEIGIAVFIALISVLIVFAGFDFWLQRWDYGKNIRLTKKEQKQEHKEHEGDPMIKARIRSVQREMARKRMMDAVKTADVIVTNPTHIAVALSYSKENMSSPKVVAKGADFLAQKIKKLASEAGVPLVENVPLARALYKSVKVGQFIPRSMFKVVAEVLAYVYKLKNKRFI